MLRRFAYHYSRPDSQNCGEFMLQRSTASRRSVTRCIPRTPLKRKPLCISLILLEMRRSSAQWSAFSLERLDALPLNRYSQHLALDLLDSCGMMPRSEERLLIGREVRADSSSLVTAGALKDLLAASLPLSLPKILSAFSLLYQRKIKFPLVNLFGGTLRLNERLRLGCHDPFIEWAC
jgi:hypothetical protein